jgi:hypothetical protein
MASAGASGVASKKCPVTGTDAVTIRKSPARYSWTRSPSMRAFAALRHDDEHRIGERVLGRHAALHLAEQYTLDRCRHTRVGVRRDESAQLGEGVGR